MALTKVHYRMIDGAYFNVLDFGADATGTENSSTAFDSAIAAANTAGRAVYIPGGNYKLSSKISIPSNIKIFGDGSISRIFRDTTVPTFDMIEVKNTAHVILQDFQIDGVDKLDNGSPANRYSGIRVWADGGTRPNDVEILGVHVNRTTSGEQQPEGNRGGISLEDCYDVRIRGCKFYDNRATAIVITIQDQTGGINTEEIQIEQCWGIGEQAPYDPSFPNGFGSFIAGKGYQDALVSGCYCDGFGFSNISMNGVRSTVQNCISLNSNYTGINVGHTNTPSNVTTSIVQGNISEGNSYEGINVSAGTNVIIDGNILKNNGTASGGGATVRYSLKLLHDANYTAGTTKKITISNNQILDSKAAAMALLAGTDIFITGNEISNAAGTGIYCSQSEASEVMDIFISNNHIHDCGTDDAAIEVNSSTAGGGGQVNALAMNNIIDTSDATSIQQMGITAVGDLADIQVHDNWFAATYTGTGVNLNFAARSTQALNAFSSGSVTNANIKNA